MSEQYKRPLTSHEQLIKVIEAKITFIKATMSPIYNAREQKQIKKLEKELKRVKGLNNG